MVTERFREAVLLHQQGHTAEALALYEEILRTDTQHAGALHLSGLIALQTGDAREAADLMRRSVAIDPNRPLVQVDLGAALLALNCPAEALASTDRALEALPDNVEALNNRANALLELRRPAEALRNLDRALSLRPTFVDAIYNRGNALVQLRRLREAIASYNRALELDPTHAKALNNLGSAQLEAGTPAQALANFERALKLQPAFALAFYGRGQALIVLKRYQEAAQCFESLIAIVPGFDYALGAMLQSRLFCCDWTNREQIVLSIATAVQAGARVIDPFVFLTISNDAEAQRRCARTYMEHRAPPEPAPAVLQETRGERYRPGRIHVAYLSANFHAHAEMQLMAGLFECHDRERFEVTAISFGPDDGSVMRARVRAAFHRFIDVARMSDSETAELVRSLGVDIAVDLMGFTKGGRPGILARRVAPVQVNYMGYPGSLAAPYIDYIIADRHVIPPHQRVCYTESVVQLPECYLVNDLKRPVPTQIPSRADVGLPPQGFVFCCFNNNYKITPSMFDIWMRLLNDVPGGVLWLLEDNAAVPGHLRSEAQHRRVAPERLIFAPRVPFEQHLARLRLADLFVDTLPYDAHTTASEALWMGLPLVTCMGNTFAGRVAGSLLHAVGLPELVAETGDEYQQRAYELATDPSLLAEIRAKLARNRQTHPLFDTDRFRRHLEAAYTTMFEWSLRRQPPESFAVEALPSSAPIESKLIM